MSIGRKVLAGVFIAGGVLHFVLKQKYLKIMPPYLPQPELLIEISGVCEIAGGCGLLVPASQFPGTQRAAAWGLIALLVAVMPANVYMAMDHAHWPGIPVSILWVRVPMQAPLIWWAWLYTRSPKR